MKKLVYFASVLLLTWVLPAEARGIRAHGGTGRHGGFGVTVHSSGLGARQFAVGTAISRPGFRDRASFLAPTGFERLAPGERLFSPGFHSNIFIGRDIFIAERAPVRVFRSTVAPVRVFQGRSFSGLGVFPRPGFVSRRGIFSDPFFCFSHHLGFFQRELFFDHIHRFHGLSFEAIPHATVQNGTQLIFFDESRSGAARSMEGTVTEGQQ